MKILFYGAKDYDQQFFDKLAPEYPGITFKFIEANRGLGDVYKRQKQISMRKPLLLPRAMMESVPL